MEDEWRETMYQEMQRELLFHEDIELIFRNAQSNNVQQIQDILELADLGVDVLIVSPNEAEPLTEVIEEVHARGIPIILLDRRINSDKYTSYIGGNNRLIGQEAGRYIENLLPDGGRVLEAYELLSIAPFRDRHQGLIDILSTNKTIHVDTVQAVDRGVERFRELVKEIPYDIVFAHTDVAARYAYDIALEEIPENKIQFIGIDGLATENGGLEWVARGILKATFLYPTGGDVAIQVVDSILNGKRVDRAIDLKTTVIDESNVSAMQIQAQKLLEQQEDISRLASKIDAMVGIFRNQRVLIYLLAFLMTASVIMLVIIFKNLETKKRINRELHQKNEQILDYSTAAEEATAAKFRFFTNISHEFRTPLTLIIAPIEDLLARQGIDTIKGDLLLIKRNTLRLLRLVNQLMDFRKIDNAQMRLQVVELDLITFIQDLMHSFQKAAEEKQIDFRLVANYDTIVAWIDPNAMDKVIFNLLSNAFKFTHSGGRITITVEDIKLDDRIRIIVEDSGSGMSEAEVQSAFDRFYQGDQNRSLGTGLGLALTREVIQLHHGSIKVDSKVGKGTRFSIELPVGSGHFTSEEIADTPVDYVVEEPLKYITEQSITTTSDDLKEYQILIIEDNPELREFLASRLSRQYGTLQVDTVTAGIQLAVEEIPDLIICDLMLQNESGYEVIRVLKSDLKTSHIPIIILSAKSDVDERIKGLKLGADDFITKPFNFNILIERINTLLHNLDKLREHYVHELPTDHKKSSPSKLDKKFVSEFVMLVESNISNSHFGVNDICREIGLSRVQLYRKVKALLGYSVNDYINGVRLKTAKHLIQKGNQSLAEIAHEVGFSSAAYFSTAFKAFFGETPSDFKKQQSRVQNDVSKSKT